MDKISIHGSDSSSGRSNKSIDRILFEEKQKNLTKEEQPKEKCPNLLTGEGVDSQKLVRQREERDKLRFPDPHYRNENTKERSKKHMNW